MSTIEEILCEAKAAGASDVHLNVGIPPKMRVNGELFTMNYSKILPADTLDILLSVMSEAQRERFEEKGEYDFSFSISGCGRFRVNAYRQRGSVALAFRLMGEKIPSPEELGLPESVTELYRRRRGLVLVTGPAGSGRSTTLAAVVNKINGSRDCHIITLEKPIEYVYSHKMSVVSQREIGTDSKSYSNALRAALREDADVIMLDELHDCETVSAAVTAAETGHLVFSALNTIGAAGAVERIIDMFPPHRQQQIRVQLANALEAVVFQQLLPASDGRGRAAAFEVMHVNREVRRLICEGKSYQLFGVMQSGKKAGMNTMDEALLRLYTEGRIDRDTAVEFAQDSGNMELMLR